MALEIVWLRPDAPYMPIVVAGLLSVLGDAGHDARVHWRIGDEASTLVVEPDLEAGDVGAAIAEAPWPDLAKIPWSTKLGQAIKPMLASAEDPIAELHRLRAKVRESGQVAEARVLEALVTDGVVDDSGGPGRSRLLRGVKADLSGLTEKVKLESDQLGSEVLQGPTWVGGRSGRGLGLVPEVQTFGGTTGPTPSDVGSHSAMLYRLLWSGIMVLPPVPVLRGRRRVVGGPLVFSAEILGWPVWTVPLGLGELRQLYGSGPIHADEPDRPTLAARGVAGVYRAASIPLNSMIAVFRWGRRVI